MVSISLAFGLSGHSKDLGGAEDLAKALILEEEKSFVVAVVDLGQHQRPADGAAKFVANKRRNAPRIYAVAVVKEIAGIECGIAHKFKQSAVIIVVSGLCGDVSKAGGSFSDFWGHDSRAKALEVVTRRLRGADKSLAKYL